ncbi:Pleckstrin y domain-containing family H member 2 [Liparis tanakae]|uniref:Pleckstrin y domain-containing family H member 2 n=1 Tax=Liparis tanakae TaxID=230148 RepID=A0A4Z2HNY3_9TELE|nr:Pleckstrin y domain-containing family H member 2 [Liparis tanakae]
MTCYCGEHRAGSERDALPLIEEASRNQLGALEPEEPYMAREPDVKYLKGALQGKSYIGRPGMAEGEEAMSQEDWKEKCVVLEALLMKFRVQIIKIRELTGDKVGWSTRHSVNLLLKVVVDSHGACLSDESTGIGGMRCRAAHVLIIYSSS